MRRLTPTAAFLGCMLSACGSAQVNEGNHQANPDQPFIVTTVAHFDFPWKLAFLPDRRLLVTEKPGKLWLVGPDGTKVAVRGAPAVAYAGQGGLLAVAAAPTFARDHGIYLTYSESGAGGSSLALAHATLLAGAGRARLDAVKVIWRDLPKGAGGQFGGYIAFAPDGKSLFLTVGERQRFVPAQDVNSALGKIVHLTLAGGPAPGNPMPSKTGASTVALIDPPADTAAAKTAAARRVAVPTPNLVPAETWTSGHRNSYGLAFDASGKLWETEMGPRGGDELNLIERGKNYGWPLVSYGVNYDGKPIPRPDTRPDLQKPVLYWTPVIAPAGLTFYFGSLFPAWKGSAFVGGLAGQSLVRVAFDGAAPREADRWTLGTRIRDVVAGPDGALWLIEDDRNGRLLRLTPKGRS